MYDGCITAQDEKDMKEGRVMRFVKCHEKVIKEYERNIEVLKNKIHEERLAIQKLQEGCLDHNFEYQEGNGEHERGCKNCGMTL